MKCNRINQEVMWHCYTNSNLELHLNIQNTTIINKNYFIYANYISIIYNLLFIFITCEKFNIYISLSGMFIFQLFNSYASHIRIYVIGYK